jgi:heparin binding hemagglutinin HbhA
MARTPLLAVLGAGDVAVTTVTRAVAAARIRAAERAERVSELPRKLNADELRTSVDELRVQAEQAYAGLAERGEKAWGRIRKQPQVRRVLATIETYTEKLDARVDDLVDDTHDAAEKALSTVTRQTRSTGEQVARATQRFAGQAAETVTEASEDASKALADAGAQTAEAGDEAASTTRSTTRKAANRIDPKTAAHKPVARRIAAADAVQQKDM